MSHDILNTYVPLVDIKPMTPAKHIDYTRVRYLTFPGAAPNQLRIDARFRTIRVLASQDVFVMMWEDVSTIRKLAMEIQQMLGSCPDDARPLIQQMLVQDLGRGSVVPAIYGSDRILQRGPWLFLPKRTH